MKFNFIIFGLVILLVNSNYAFSKIKIEPRFTLSEIYNDNIFLENRSGADSDWITTATPGLGLIYDVKELRVDLDYSLYFINYKNHSEENESSLREVQRMLGEALVFPERDFTLALSGEISRVVIDDREQSVAENEFFNKATLYHFAANPQYQWRVLPTFSAIFGYRFDSFNYVADEGDDAETHHYSLSLVKELVTGTKVKINGFQEDYRAENKIDYRLRQVTGGLTQQVGPRWSIEAEVGAARVDFDTGLDAVDLILAVNVTGRIAKNLQLVLVTDRAFFVSVNAGLIKRTQASAALRYQDVFVIEPNTDIELNTFLELKTYWMEDRYQTETRIDRFLGGLLAGGIPLSRKFILNVEGDITHYEFLPEDENALRFGAGASLEYVGRRTNVSLGYTFRSSNSDIDANDYINNIVTLTCRMRF